MKPWTKFTFPWIRMGWRNVTLRMCASVKATHFRLLQYTYCTHVHLLLLNVTVCAIQLLLAETCEPPSEGI